MSDEVKKNKFNLGSNNVRKTFFSILVPTLIAQLIAGTFVIFDTFFISHGFHPGSIFEGIGSLGNVDKSYAALGPAAISYAMPYTFFIIGMGLAIGAGLATIMTKQFTNKDKTGIQKTMNSFAPMTIMLGVAMMIVLLIGAKFLVWFGSGFQKDYLNAWFDNPLLNKNWSENIYNDVNGHIFSQAAWFLRIQALGTIPYIYMCGGVIMLRVQGKAQNATSFSAVGLVVNIVLDFIFIIVLKMNIIGAAIATVIGQYATASIYYYYFKKKAVIVKATKMDWQNSKSIFRDVMKNGVSIMMLQVLSGLILISFTFIIGITNYGYMYKVTNYTAVYQGYNAIFIFSNLVVIGIAQSMKPIVGYNHALENKENIKKARFWGYSTSIGFSVVMTFIVLIATKEVIGLFYSVNGFSEDYITTGYFNNNPPSGFSEWTDPIFTNGMGVAILIVRLLFITFPIATMISISGTYIQGIGEDKRTSILLFGKVILLILLALTFGFFGDGLIHSNWKFLDQDGNNIKALDNYTNANLGLFMSLPITDLVIGSLLIYYLIDSEKRIIIPMKDKEEKNEVKKEKNNNTKETIKIVKYI